MARHKDCEHGDTKVDRQRCRRENDPAWWAARMAKKCERQRVRRLDPQYRLAERPRIKALVIKRRRVMADTAVEPIVSDDIFERDGWICHLCGNPVDPFAFHPHPESPSLDHIIPLSLGGTHTHDNVACSHLRCNTSKGNRYEIEL